MKNILSSIPIVFLTLVIISGCNKAENGEKVETIDTHKIHTNELALKNAPVPKLQAPNFALSDIDGGKFRLSNHIGKVVVLNYWATFCGPCVIEIPDFIELQYEMKDEPVLFVGISSSLDKAEDVRSFARENEVNYPLLLDKKNVFAEKYQSGMMAAPMTFIINHRGEVAHVITGMTSKELLKPLIRELNILSQKS